MDIINEIKESFKKGTYLTQLIYVNLVVFVIVNLLAVFTYLSGSSINDSLLIEWLSVPADTSELIWQPWTLISYMFLQEQFLHLLFNMLWLFWFGKIFLQYLDQKHLLSVYLLGGIFGALVYILAYNLFPGLDAEGSYALGASASVMAVVFATASYVPNYELTLMFIGKVKLKYIALVTIVLDLINIQPNNNAGGHIAHIGGALFGLYFISEYKKGKLITKGFSKILDGFFNFFKKKPKMKVSYKKTGNKDHDYNSKKVSEQEQMNVILEKISKSGYTSLSKTEKELLFKMSDKK